MDISDVLEPSLLKRASFLALSLFFSASRFIFVLTKIGHFIAFWERLIMKVSFICHFINDFEQKLYRTED